MIIPWSDAVRDAIDALTQLVSFRLEKKYREASIKVVNTKTHVKSVIPNVTWGNPIGGGTEGVRAGRGIFVGAFK